MPMYILVLKNERSNAVRRNSVLFTLFFDALLLLSFQRPYLLLWLTVCFLNSYRIFHTCCSTQFITMKTGCQSGVFFSQPHNLPISCQRISSREGINNNLFKLVNNDRHFILKILICDSWKHFNDKVWMFMRYHIVPIFSWKLIF